MIKIKHCTSCLEEIHPKRLEILPTTTKCVKCSTVQKKGTITVMKGEGDHTWIETIHLEADEYKQYKAAEKKYQKNKGMLLNNID